MVKLSIYSSFFALVVLLVCFQGINARFGLKRPRDARVPKAESKCPAAPLIVPCTCDSELISCSSETGPISQESINNAFRELRQLYNVTIDQQLQMEQAFLITSETMTTLDITPLLNSRFSAFGIIDCPKLTRIHGPVSGSGSSKAVASIAIDEMVFRDTKLNDEGLSDFFPYLTTSVYDIEMENNDIRGPPLSNNNATEFFTGIGRLSLAYFYLSSNKIEVLGGGSPFQLMGYTRILDLSNNSMREVREGALYVDDSTADFERLRQIYMWENNLNDESFHVRHGLERFKGPIHLELQKNKFTFFSAEKFEPFLQANSENYINLDENPFLCDDERNSWLSAYRNQVSSSCFF